MKQWFELVITIVCSVIASSGFWAYLQKRAERKDSRSKMLIGLGHDRIMNQGMIYISRGWITNDEYENLYEYLYKPYKEMGGNGSAERIMSEVNRLPIHEAGYKEEEDET